MALHSPREPEVTRAALTDWLSTRIPGADGLTVSELSGPPSTGFSNETIVLDASWIEGGRARSEGFVVRVRPSSHTVFPHHRFEEQFRVIEALGRIGSVPVPPMRWFESSPRALGAPFMVMERVAGTAPSDVPPYSSEGWLHDSPPDLQAQVWWEGLEALAKVNTVDWRAAGLDFLTDGDLAGGGSPSERLAWWEQYAQWAGGDDDHPVLDRADAWLRAHLPVDKGVRALCWGDARIGNQLFAGHRVAAVLDWEMVHVGDPVWDLAWYIWLDRHFSEGCDLDRLPGLPGYGDTAARWEQLTGFEATELGWHQVLSGYAFGAVMVRLAALLVEYEFFPADSDFAHTNTAVMFLAAELDRIGAP